jgi:hypothetical protein
MRAGPYAAQLAAPASQSGQKFIPDLDGLLRSHLPAQIATCVAADPKLDECIRIATEFGKSRRFEFSGKD